MDTNSQITKTENITSWRHQYLPTARLHVSEEPFVRSSLARFEEALTEEILDKYFADSLKRLWSKYSSQVVRDVRDAQERGLTSILSAVLKPDRKRHVKKKSLDLEKAYGSVKKFLARQGSPSLIGKLDDFIKRYETDESISTIVQDIYQIEQDIERAMSTRHQLQQLIENLYTGDKHVTFEDDDIKVRDSGGAQIGLSSLSSGEKHLMRILVETLLAEENTILIDEPELSMHIDWQHDLVKNLRILNPNAQLILATHSPEIMADISDDRIFKI